MRRPSSTKGVLRASVETSDEPDHASARRLTSARKVSPGHAAPISKGSTESSASRAQPTASRETRRVQNELAVSRPFARTAACRTGDSSSYATAGRPPESTAQSRSGRTACNPADFGEVQDTKRLRTGVAVQASVCVMSKVNIEIEREAEGLSD